jgi:hypothetical protein
MNQKSRIPQINAIPGFFHFSPKNVTNSSTGLRGLAFGISSKYPN